MPKRAVVIEAKKGKQARRANEKACESEKINKSKPR
jgi:hypothetical protein